MVRHWKKLIAWSVGAVALFAALGFLAVPPLARSQLEKLLAEQLQRPVRVERVEFNPFTLKAAIEGVSVGGRAPADPPLAALRRIDADLAWRSVIERAPIVQRLTVSGPQLRLAREAEGRYDVDDLIEKWSADPAEPPDPQAPPPRFAIANIVIEDGRFDFEDKVLPRTHEVTGLALQIPFISSLKVHQEIDVEPKLVATINGAALDLTGRSRPFSATHESALDLAIAPIDLAQYVGYLPAGLPVRPVAGVLSGELTVKFAQPEADGPVVAVTGALGLAGLRVQDPAGVPLLSVESLKAQGLKLEPLASAYAIERLSVDGAAASVHRRRGEARFVERVLAAVEKRAAAAKEDSATPGGALRWSLGEFSLSAGTVDLLDERFEPRPLAVKLLGVSARVSGLGSDPSSSVPYTLAFTLESGEKVETEGSMTLEPLLVEGKVAASAVSLKNWWWLAEPQLQANLLDGRLSAQTGYRFAVNGADADLTLGGLAAQLESLKLAQRWDRREFLRIDSLKLADASVDVGARRVEIGSVEGNAGRLALSRDRKGVMNLQRLLGLADGAQPRKAVATPAPASQEPGWTVGLGKLSIQRWNASLTDALAGRDGDLQLSQLSLSAQGFDTARKDRGKVSLKTRVGKVGALAVSGDLGLSPLGGRLRIDADRVGVLPAQPWFTEFINAVVSSGALSAKGNLGFDVPARGPVRASWRGDVTVSDFAAVTKEANEDLLRWKSLRAGSVDFVLEPLKVDVGELALTGFYSRVVLSSEGRLNLQDVLVSSAEEAEVEAQAAREAREKAAPARGAAAQTGSGVAQSWDGSVQAWDGPAQAGGGGAKAAPAAGPPRAPSAPLPVRLGKITLEDGSVYFTDNFIRPNYSASLTELAGSVSTITPDTAGDVQLRGKVEKTGSLEIVGSLNPLAPTLFLDLKAIARDIDLPPTMPYSVKYLGYGIEKGKLSATVHYKLEDRRLQAENNVVLDQLTFGDKVDSPTATKLPVLFAVALLKDRNGVIDVDMPVRGSLDDPEFSIGGLVVRMIFNLIGKVITAPFSMLAKLGGGSADLSQIAFAPGSARLDPGTVERLQTLAKALGDRPALRVDLAGRADPQGDREALMGQALQRLVKAEKAREIVRGGDPAPSLDEIQLSAEEYPRYLKQAYRRGDFEKPRNAIGLVRDQPVDEMERRLLEHVRLDEGALRALADQRAQAARAWLVANGVGADRLFVVAPRLDRKGLDDKASATAVDLSLK